MSLDVLDLEHRFVRRGSDDYIALLINILTFQVPVNPHKFLELAVVAKNENHFSIDVVGFWEIFLVAPLFLIDVLRLGIVHKNVTVNVLSYRGVQSSPHQRS